MDTVKALQNSEKILHDACFKQTFPLISMCLVFYAKSAVARDLYNGILVGLIVQKKKISGLRERVNITMQVTKNIRVSATSFHHLFHSYFTYYSIK